MAEIVAVTLHGETVNANHTLLFLLLTPVVIVVIISIVACLSQHLVGNEILAGLITFHDGTDKVLGNIGIIGQQLLGVLGKTITAVAERRVVVMGTYAGIETNTVDDLVCVQTLELGIGVQLVEIANPQGQIGVGKKFHGLSLC